MHLYCNGELVGILTKYEYDFPWAYARLTPQDTARFARLCGASRFLDYDLEEDWGDLSREAEEQEYARRLGRYGITEADIDLIQRGQWAIRAAAHADWNGPIRLSRCSSDGWVQWRW